MTRLRKKVEEQDARIDDLCKRIDDLCKRLWIIENPPKFKSGDKVRFIVHDMYHDIEYDTEVICIEGVKFSWCWYRTYFIKLPTTSDGSDVTTASENYLCLIKTTQN